MVIKMLPMENYQYYSDKALTSHTMHVAWLVVIIVVSAIVGVCLLVLTVIGTIGACFRINNVKCKSNRRLDGQTTLVTGGTSGMGLEVAAELARRGAKVIIACPFEEEGQNGKQYIINKTNSKNVIFKLLNLGSLASVRSFAEDILKSEDRLDILVNNAGVIFPDKRTDDGMNFVMEVNYFGHFLLTLLLLPLLKRSGERSRPSRIVNVSSMSHSRGSIDLENLHFVGYKMRIMAYANSKLCVTMFTQELSKRLINDFVVVNSADPGVAATGISNGYGPFSNIFKHTIGGCYPTPWEGAQTTIYLALDQKGSEVSGEYFKNCKLTKPGKNANNDTLSTSLWLETIKIVKLSEEELRLSLQ